MSMFTITPAQWAQNLAAHSSRMGEIDKMLTRGGRDWRLRNQPIPTYTPPPDQSAATMRDVSPPVTYTPHQISQARAAGLEAFGKYGPSEDVLAVQPPPAPPPVASPATTVQPTIDDYSPIYPDEQKAWDSAVVGPDKARLVGGLKLKDGRYTGEVKDAPPDLTVSPARQMINKLVGEGATGNVRTRLRMQGFFNPIKRFITDDPQERARMDFQDKAVNWLDSNAGAAWVNANPQKLMELWNRGGNVVDLYTMVTGDKPYTGPASPVSTSSSTSVAGPPLPTTPLTTNNNVPKFSMKERAYLYAIVQAEAGDQSKKGKQAVAATIINRINSGNAYNEWKDKKGRLTLMSVLKAPGQFEPVSRAGSLTMMYRKFGGNKTDSSTRQAVQELLKDFSGTNPVGNALFFQSPQYSGYGRIFPSLQPYFESGNPNPTAPIPANSPIKKIGGHVFTPRYNQIPGVPEEDDPFGSSPASGKNAGLTTSQSSQLEPVKPGDEVDHAGVFVPLSPPPAATKKVIKDNTGATRTIPSEDKPSTSAGVLTDGTKSPTHEAVTRKNPKPRILSNWSPAMFNEEVEKGKEALRSAQYAAQVALQNWDGEMFDKAVIASDNAATTLRNILVQKLINGFENGADGSRLAAMEAQASGKPTVIRPRSDGNFDIEVNGQIVREGLSRAEVVSMFRKAASQRFTAAVNSAEVARNVARAENRAKKDLELSKILTKGQWDIWLEEHKPNITKTDDGGVLFKDPTGIFKVTPRGPTENEKELNPDKETYFDVTPIRTRGGEFSSAAPISGLTLYKQVTGSK